MYNDRVAMGIQNLYGNIISNIGSALVGGPGVVAGSNLGAEYACKSDVSGFVTICGNADLPQCCR